MPAFRDKTQMKETGEANVRLKSKHDQKLFPQ